MLLSLSSVIWFLVVRHVQQTVIKPESRSYNQFLPFFTSLHFPNCITPFCCWNFWGKKKKLWSFETKQNKGRFMIMYVWACKDTGALIVATYILSHNIHTAWNGKWPKQWKVPCFIVGKNVMSVTLLKSCGENRTHAFVNYNPSDFWTVHLFVWSSFKQVIFRISSTSV